VQYLALIYSDEDAWAALADDERAAVYDRYATFASDARAAGVLGGGDELAPARDATTVRIRDAQTLVTDGPYAEVREALGGFFVLDCPSLEEALDWVARIPAVEHGAVELRPTHFDPEEVHP
jgi:hypothetical protein